MDIRKLVGRNAVRLRKAAGMTQEELSERSGLSQQYISGLERGSRNPTVLSLYELANALKANPVDLLAPDESHDG
jgi:transcriptional regulator with XRE-family HTH domain